MRRHGRKARGQKDGRTESSGVHSWLPWVVVLVLSAAIGSLLGTHLRTSGGDPPGVSLAGVGGHASGKQEKEKCVLTLPTRVLPPVEQCAARAATPLPAQLERDIYLPNNGTRWSGIMASPSDQFFKRWLAQYPPNTNAGVPVLVFAHEKAIRHGSQRLPNFCRVMDVALVPDRPGLCTSVTETNHDMASYHMLKSEVQEGSATDSANYEVVPPTARHASNVQYVPMHSLSSNSMLSRSLPQELDYSRTRDMLQVFFQHNDAVAETLRVVPIHNASEPGYRRTQWVGCVVVDLPQAELFRNSVLSAMALGVNYKKFWAFTPSAQVRDALLGSALPGMRDPMQTVFLPGLDGLRVADLAPELSTHFLQAWLAFALAAQGSRMLWQAPATAWLERPDRLVNRARSVEIVSVYKGRGDHNSEPFYPSFDFIAFGTEDRPVHLLHEVVMHFDLVLAWQSLDAVLSYRLAENNARYGTSVAVLDPEVVMHGDVFLEDTNLEESLRTKTKKPLALALSREDVNPEQAKAKLKDLGYWYIKE